MKNSTIIIIGFIICVFFSIGLYYSIPEDKTWLNEVSAMSNNSKIICTNGWEGNADEVYDPEKSPYHNRVFKEGDGWLGSVGNVDNNRVNENCWIEGGTYQIPGEFGSKQR